ncbi:MAG: hypothetical protein AAF799_29695 [Myxococcota bacterium]
MPPALVLSAFEFVVEAIVVEDDVVSVIAEGPSDAGVLAVDPASVA